MKTTELIIAAGFASSNSEAVRLMQQGAVRYGKLLTFQPLPPEQDWEREYYGKEYIELYQKITDRNHEFTSPEDADGWYLFVGKRRAIHVPDIGKKIELRSRLVMDIKSRVIRDDDGIYQGLNQKYHIQHQMVEVAA